jgi:hypothetical protein
MALRFGETTDDPSVLKLKIDERYCICRLRQNDHDHHNPVKQASGNMLRFLTHQCAAAEVVTDMFV